MLALDINGMTPALCCAPNNSVAQCLALILANYTISSLQNDKGKCLYCKIEKKLFFNISNTDIINIQPVYLILKIQGSDLIFNLII